MRSHTTPVLVHNFIHAGVEEEARSPPSTFVMKPRAKTPGCASPHTAHQRLRCYAIAYLRFTFRPSPSPSWPFAAPNTLPPSFAALSTMGQSPIPWAAALHRSSHCQQPRTTNFPFPVCHICSSVFRRCLAVISQIVSAVPLHLAMLHSPFS
ncbi:hypothetical protein TRVL_05370 [Trypanosoma vivax]|nr:hypothetical protein TRVL_05370 [Trypanosoma vivax]